jgi:hypothetical protein
VHLDYPWNPARLEQRVGRVRRLGSRHDVVTVYTIAPPASAERMIGIERRLREKLCVAQRAIGLAGQILPSLLGGDEPAPSQHTPSVAERASTVARLVRRWRTPGDCRRPDLEETLIGAAESPCSGFIALVRDERGAHIVGDAGAGIDLTAPTIERLLGVASGPDRAVDQTRAAGALSALDRWSAIRRGAATIDLHAALTARARRAALDRIAQSLGRAPRHQRARLAPLADAARAAATAPLGEGAERVLDTLVSAQLPDEAWLRTIATFGELNARPSAANAKPMARRVVALLLLGPPNG